MLRFSRRLQEHYGRFGGPHTINEGVCVGCVKDLLKNKFSPRLTTAKGQERPLAVCGFIGSYGL